jgi:hypothetical protein
VILAYLRTRRSLLAELEALREANARLREQLETAQIQSWIRNPPRRVQSAPRAEPHPVRAGRHQADVTEYFPRRPR